MAAHAIFLVDGKEANGTVYHFCSEICQIAFSENESHTHVLGMSADYVDGTICDKCGKILKEALMVTQMKIEVQNLHAQTITDASFYDEGRVFIEGKTKSGVPFRYQIVVTSEGIIVDAVDTSEGETLEAIVAAEHTDYFDPEA